MAREVGHHKVAVTHLGAERHPNYHIVAPSAGFVRAPAVATIAGFEVDVTPKVVEVAQAFIGFNPDAATVTTVTTVGAAARHMLLAAKRDAAVAPRPAVTFILARSENTVKDDLWVE